MLPEKAGLSSVVLCHQSILKRTEITAEVNARGSSPQREGLGKSCLRVSDSGWCSDSGLTRRGSSQKGNWGRSQCVVSVAGPASELEAGLTGGLSMLLSRAPEGGSHHLLASRLHEGHA